MAKPERAAGPGQRGQLARLHPSGTDLCGLDRRHGATPPGYTVAALENQPLLARARTSATHLRSVWLLPDATIFSTTCWSRCAA